MELSIGLHEFAVHPLAFITPLHILLDVTAHVPPKETAADLLESLVTSQMSTYTIIDYYYVQEHGNDLLRAINYTIIVVCKSMVN